MYSSHGAYKSGSGASSAGSRHSNESQESRSTAPTSIYSYETSLKCYARSSSETYASTIASLKGLCEEPGPFNDEYSFPEYRDVVTESDIRPTNPQDFAEYFPSTKRLLIRHDDTSFDGNMNLRVDTETCAAGRKKESVQLFHLRMFDLKKREFSFRRYERSSGREICRTNRKYAKPGSGQRPTLTRSVSNAFTSIRKPDFKRTSSGLSTHAQKSRKDFKRRDSGNASNNDEDEERDLFPEDKSCGRQVPTNITKLEFSNYAQVEVSRQGKKSSRKRYVFEYWGQSYIWKRIVEKDGAGKAVSYHLYRGDDGHAVAHIVPELRSASEMRDEAAAGGWVPPCSMWINDRSIVEAITDVPDVIVATGLIVLIDDSIKSRFHSKNFSNPMTARLKSLSVELVTPRAMVQHIFKRQNSGASTKEKESPLRWVSNVAAC